MKRSIDDIIKLQSVAEQVNEQEIVTACKFLRQRVANPSAYLVFLGETCSGKSAVINAICNRDVLPVSAIPSTGSIIEICADEEDKYALIYKNATMRILSKKEFVSLALFPEKNQNRLRAQLQTESLGKIRIFDTPGYDSLVSEHEEVLSEFLENSDGLIYVVDYHSGIKRNDFEYLYAFRELLDDDTPVYLIINKFDKQDSMTDAGVLAIIEGAKDIFNKKLYVNVVPYLPESKAENIFPYIAGLKEAIVKDLNSDNRQAAICNTLNDTALEIASSLENVISREIAVAEADEKDYQELLDHFKQKAKKLRNAENEIIIPAYKQIRENIPPLIFSEKEKLKRMFKQEIEAASYVSKEDIRAFVVAHLIPLYSREGCKHVMSYICEEIDRMNQKLEEYALTALDDSDKEASMRMNNPVIDEIARATAELSRNAIYKGFVKYFVKYGGQGGTKAGIANGASHLLKKAGDLFGHTFSRETHTALKHTLKKLGLTSVKTLAAAASAIIDVLEVGIDALTWKPLLIRNMTKAVDDWGSNLEELIHAELDDSEKDNIEVFNLAAKQYEVKIDRQERSISIEKLYELLDEVKGIVDR